MKALTFGSTNFPRVGVAPDENGVFVPVLTLEGSATNILTDSEASTAWTKTRSLATANSGIAPDATTSATKLTGSTANNTHFARHTFASTNNDTITFAPYCKAGELGWCKLELSNKAGVGEGAYFNLNTGVIGTVDSTGITARINTDLLADRGYVRPSITRGMSSGASTPACDVMLATSDGANSFSGSSTAGIFVDMLHAEKNEFAGTYIKTVGATRSRGNDRTSLPFPHRPQTGTFYIKGRLIGASKFSAGTYGRWLHIGSDPSLRIDVSSTGTNQPRLLVKDEAGVFSGSVPATTSVVPGNVIETLGVLDSTSLQATAVIDGGTEVVGSKAAIANFPAAWPGETIYLGHSNAFNANADYELMSFKFAAGVRTMAEMRKLP